MKTQTIHETLVARMAKYKGQHAQIARDTGVAQSTVSRASKGDVSPTLAVVQPILDWMDAQDRLLAKKTTVRVLPAAASLRKKRKKQHADTGNLKDFKPARPAHG